MDVVSRGFEEQVRQARIMSILVANQSAYQGLLFWRTRVTS